MATKRDILGMDSDEFIGDARSHIGKGSGLAAEIYRNVFSTEFPFPTKGLAIEKGQPFIQAAMDASAGERDTLPDPWSGRYKTGYLAVDSVLEQESEAGLTSKVTLLTADGHRVECVRVPMSRRNDTCTATLCVSSQIGCRMGCAFCQTGTMGLVRNLEAAEIVSQVVTLRKEFGWNFRNIVFMGMGEPLDNFDNVTKAMNVFHDQRGLGLAWDRITLCTSGSVSGINRLKELGLKRLGLSISLNSGLDEVRSSIMPVNRSSGLAALAEALASYPQRKNFVLGVNYCLLPGINDGRKDAVAVAGFCSRAGRCLVNLIPYNPGTAPLSRAPSEEEVLAFIGHLESEGVLVKRRIEKGRSIMAGCGQLGGSRGCGQLGGNSREGLGQLGEHGADRG